MKKIKLLSGLLAMLFAAMLISSCVDDEFDTPPTNPIPVGDVTTISAIKALSGGSDHLFTSDVTVYGTVTMDDKSGNIYKTAYIQDATDAIALHLDASGGIYQGDSVRIQLNGLKVGTYKNLYQIDAVDGNGFNLDYAVTKIKTLVNVEPEVVTISQLSSKQGRLVKLENVQFVPGDTAVTYADTINQYSVSLTIENASKETAIVRTSGYASFAGSKTPTGSGSLVAVVGQYNNDMQLQIRSLDEVIMNDERVGGVSGTPAGAGTFDDPYNVAAGQTNQGETGVWVEGYIVGVYETQDAGGTQIDPFVASFTSPFNTPHNLLIADNQNETNIANCVIVKLTSGEIRNTLNLVDNSTNLAKTVKVYGELGSYFTDEGLINVTGYWFEGAGIVPGEITGFFVEEFSGSLGQFNQYSVSGTNTWIASEYGGTQYAEMSGYTTSATENEDWLISNAIDCSSYTNLYLRFRHTAKFVNGQWQMMKVFMCNDYDGSSDPNTSGTWTEITGYANPPGTDYTFVESGALDVSSFNGNSTVYIAFKYACNNTDSPKWEIDYVTLNNE